MGLKDLDCDIPTALVKEYKATDKPYVDEGRTFFLPLLLTQESHVSRVSSGFQSRRTASLILGLLAYGQETAAFDANGQLSEYSGRGHLLTGLLLSDSEEKIRKDGRLAVGAGWSTLWGAIGHHRTPSGQRTVRFLWIPIPAGTSTVE